MEDKIKLLEKIFPEVITEKNFGGEIKKAVDFDKLKDILQNNISDARESYNFTWVGKNKARAEAYRKIDKTLRPCVDESKNFDTTENIYIEGDNLEVLKLLQKSYQRKIKMIYIDPPYNTGNDFIYRDNFTMSEEDFADGVELYDENENLNFSANPETNPRFHSDWCSMIYSRLLLARNLLTDDGVIFISIDDNEQANLKKICDEVFGENNFVTTIHWRRTESQNNTAKLVSNVAEYIHCYLKFKSQQSFFNKISLTFQALKEYRYQDEKGFFRRGTISDNTRGKHRIEVISPTGIKNTINSIRTKKFIDEQDKNGMIYWTANGLPYLKIYLDDSAGQVISNWFDDVGVNEDANETLKNLEIPFSFSKPYTLIKKLIAMSTDEDAIILDFFSGSGTTAHAVMELNSEDGGRRKFIMVQLAEKCGENTEAYKAGYKNICEIGKERIRRAGDKITADIDKGFRVFKLASSNFKEFNISPAELTQEMLWEFAENIKPDRNDLDLLFGCLIELLKELHLPCTQEKFEGATIYNYNDGDLIACFDKNISQAVIKYIANKKPRIAIFRESCFTRDDQKINTSEIFKMYDIKFKVI